MSSVYGPTFLGDKLDFFKDFRTLKIINRDKYWIAGGYYNMIASFDERKGGTGRYLQEMQDFTDLIMDTNLVDVQTTNGKFTWNYRRGGIHQIASRLDCFLVSKYFVSLDIFYEASIVP